MNTIKFYHGTSQENVEKIFAEGLKGGDNSKGGTHGSWEEPTLFLAVNDWVAQKYGTVIEITLTEEQLDELGARRIIDGLGDECYIIEGEKGKFDEILIPAKYLSQLSNNDEELSLCIDCSTKCLWAEEQDGLCCSCAKNTDLCEKCLEE